MVRSRRGGGFAGLAGAGALLLAATPAGAGGALPLFPVFHHTRETADLVLLNGRIETLDPRGHLVQARTDHPSRHGRPDHAPGGG